MMQFEAGCWGLIIGGSSGFGLAAAQKLARHGMNLCIVHRDRRAAMRQIAPAFEGLKEAGVDVRTFNLDGLSEEGRKTVLDGLSEALAGTGRVRLLLHAVAFGNLKLLAEYRAPDAAGNARQKMAEETGLPLEKLNQIVEDSFAAGYDALYPLQDPTPDYAGRQMLEKEDFARTIQAMGYNILEWAKDVLDRGLFAEDARVLSLTSEGNSVAWRGYAAVSAAKAVLESVSRSMAVELAPYGIRSNVIQAGVTETPALRAIPGNRRISAQSRLRNPFGRLTTPEDVADVIWLLCLDEAAWINGALICADGGERLG
jgi:NAD(P)-dependent dehydrogenase (short-subunit alcohol dehydrogenase family)